MDKDCIKCKHKVANEKTNWGYCSNEYVINDLIQQHRGYDMQIPPCLVARTYSCNGKEPKYWEER